MGNRKKQLGEKKWRKLTDNTFQTSIVYFYGIESMNTHESS